MSRSTDTDREPEESWMFQQVLLYLNSEESLDVMAMVDNGSGISCLPDRVVKKMGLWDRVEVHSQEYSPMNKRYLQLLHKLTRKAREEQEFCTSKLRLFHKAIVKVFGFEETTHFRRFIGHGLDARYRYYSIGQIRLRYAFLETVEDENQIPWDTHTFLVVDSSGDFLDRPNLDVLIGRDTGTLDALWWQQHIRRRTRRPTVRQTTPTPLQ